MLQKAADHFEAKIMQEVILYRKLYVSVQIPG